MRHLAYLGIDCFFKVMYDVPNGTTKSEEKEMSDVEEPSEHNGEEKSKKPKEALDVKEEGKDILSSPAKKEEGTSKLDGRNGWIFSHQSLQSP